MLTQQDIDSIIYASRACDEGPTQLARRIESAVEDAEIARLTSALLKANSQTEQFEREWYLRGDEIEWLTSEVAELRKNGPTMRRGINVDGTPWMGTMRDVLNDYASTATTESILGDEARADARALQAQHDDDKSDLLAMQRERDKLQAQVTEQALQYLAASTQLADAYQDAQRHAFRRDNPEFSMDIYKGQYRFTHPSRADGIWCDSYDAAIDEARPKP